MRGRECGCDERIDATVDFPVAIEPVSPIMSIMRKVPPHYVRDGGWENEVGWLHNDVLFGTYM